VIACYAMMVSVSAKLQYPQMDRHTVSARPPVPWERIQEKGAKVRRFHAGDLPQHRLLIGRYLCRKRAGAKPFLLRGVCL
jgi:hypothetical protein